MTEYVITYTNGHTVRTTNRDHWETVLRLFGAVESYGITKLPKGE